MMKTILKIEGMSCGHCEKSLQNILEEIDGVEDVLVSVEKDTAEMNLTSISVEKVIEIIERSSNFTAHTI